MHAAHVRVDPRTGHSYVLDYAMVHDTGTVINLLIVQGQHHGGVLLGLGMALGEEYVDDEQGHMLNASFSDYWAPQAVDLPELYNTFEIPAASRAISGGMKGAGESSVGSMPAAIGNAVADATGIRFTVLPMTPRLVVGAVERAPLLATSTALSIVGRRLAEVPLAELAMQVSSELLPVERRSDGQRQYQAELVKSLTVDAVERAFGTRDVAA